MTQSASVLDLELHFTVRGDGVPLLLLHGGCGVGHNWDIVFGDAPKGFRLIQPDARGHGMTVNPSADLTFHQLATDVFALLDYLELSRVKAIGVSLGAKTLLHAASMCPERIESMVLVSATPRFPEAALAALREMVPEKRSHEEWEQMRKWHQHGDSQIEKLWNHMRAWGEGDNDMQLQSEQLAAITSKTLLIHGDRDQLYPVDSAQTLLSMIPNSYLSVIPNAGHGPIYGQHTDPFVKMALSFLRDEW